MAGRPSPVARIRAAGGRAGWLALAAAFAAGGLAESLAEHRGALGIAVALGMGAATAFAWWRPLTAVAAMTAIAAGQAAFDDPLYDLSIPLYAIPAAIILLAARRDGPAVAAGLLLGAVMFAVVLAPAEEIPLGDILFAGVLLLGLPAIVGRTFHSRARLNAELRERARRLSADRETRAREAAAAERRRIAGELHDLVAHGVSGMVVQAGAARRLVARGDARAPEAIRAVEDGGREALDELRRLLGVLRHEDADLALAPQPSLSRVAALVAELRERGLEVQLRVHGEPGPMSPGVDVAAYRLVEDALRGATDRTVVLVHYGEQAVDIIIDGLTPEPERLVGLGERVKLFGGELGAARRGNALRAHLPLFGGPA